MKQNTNKVQVIASTSVNRHLSICYTFDMRSLHRGIVICVLVLFLMSLFLFSTNIGQYLLLWTGINAAETITDLQRSQDWDQQAIDTVKAYAQTNPSFVQRLFHISQELQDPTVYPTGPYVLQPQFSNIVVTHDDQQTAHVTLRFQGTAGPGITQQTKVPPTHPTADINVTFFVDRTQGAPALIILPAPFEVEVSHWAITSET